MELGFAANWLIHNIIQEENNIDYGFKTDLAKLKIERYKKIIQLLLFKYKKIPLITEEAEKWWAEQIELCNQLPITQPTPQLQGLTTNLTESQTKELLIKLKENGYIDEASTEDNWLAVFCFKEFTKDFSRIVWIKKTSTNKQPNKRSLLCLLELINCCENDIKNNINKLFVVEGANEFNSKNDFNEFFLNSKETERAALRNRNSEYESDLNDIVKTIIQPNKS